MASQVVVGGEAPDFLLKDQNGTSVSLSSLVLEGAVLLVFYPGDFTPVCTKQLCNYRDNLNAFMDFGIQVVGVSRNSPAEHQEFTREYDFAFPLLSDPQLATAKLYGATSIVMLGGISRAVYIISKTRKVLYRYVEPTVLSRRTAGELLEILAELKNQDLI